MEKLIVSTNEHRFFYNRNVQVNSKDEEYKVLEILQQYGYLWNSGKLSKDIIPSERAELPLYIYANSNGKLMYGRYMCYDLEKTKPMTIEEFMTHDTTNCTPSTPAFKLVSKLEDLDKEDNGNGIYLSWDKKNKSLDVVYKGTTFCYWTENHEVKVWVGVLKAMGFKFEMKSKRTKEEILDEIEKLAEVPSENEDRYRIGADYPRVDVFGFWKLDTNITTYPRVKGLTKEDAVRLCKELNSL